MKSIITLILIGLYGEVAMAETDFFFAPYSQTQVGTVTVNLKQADAVPEDQSDFGHYWYSLPRDTMTQSIRDLTYSIEPTEIRSDAHGNNIAHWAFDESLDLQIKFRITSHNVLTAIDPAKVGSYDRASDEYKLYTRDERLTAITPDIQAIAEKIKAASDSNPYLLAWAAFSWVLDHFAYAPVPSLHRDRGVREITASPFVFDGRTYYKGDCGSYTFVFNAILRALGIPARMAVGGWTFGADQYHVWSEVLIPGYGWIPVDTSSADVFVYDEGPEWNRLGQKTFEAMPAIVDPYYFFGNIDPFRFVSSLGTDIPINPRVNWDFSAYDLSWLYHEGVAGVMQIGVFHILLDQRISMTFEDVD